MANSSYLEAALDRLMSDPGVSKMSGTTTDQTVEWKMYRVGQLIRIDLKPTIGTWPADDKRDPREEPGHVG